MIIKIIDKLIRELYRLFHPRLWGKRMQINGIPYIVGWNNLRLGKDISINGRVFIQAADEVVISDRVTLSRGCTILSSGLKTDMYIENAQKKYRDHIMGGYQLVAERGFVPM